MFFPWLRRKIQQNNTILCVGLDPPLDLSEDLSAFGHKLLDASADLACCCKPNIAFYEARGERGWRALRETIAHAHAADLPVILDCKRGDVGSTAEAYAAAAYGELDADAVTLSPYLGIDGIRPFLRPGKGIFVLCRTSNPSSEDLQTLETGGEPLYAAVARRALAWLADREAGLVVGAMSAGPVSEIRRLAPAAWFLMPGLGAQGGDLEAIRAGVTADGLGVIAPVSRAISSDPDPRARCRALRDELNHARRGPGAHRSGV